MENIKSSEITSESDFLNRRQLIRAAGFTGIAALTLPTVAQAGLFDSLFGNADEDALKYAAEVYKSSYPTADEITDFKYFSTYTNYYEFSTDKARSNVLAQGWKPKDDWLMLKDSVTGKQVVVDYDKLVAKMGPPEERIYRFRCVEAWGGNFVWNGWPLHKVLKAFGMDTKAGHHMAMYSAYEDDMKFGPYKEGMQTEVAE